MSIANILKIAMVNTIRYRKKSIISIIMVTISIYMLLNAITIKINLYESVNNEMNSLEGQKVVRAFEMTYTSDNNIDKKDVKEDVLTCPHIQRINFISCGVDGQIRMRIIVDDYSNVNRVLAYFDNKINYNIFVKEENIINARIIKISTYLSNISICIIMILTYIIIYIQIKNIINGKKYEMALYKTFGYRSKNILFIILFQEYMIVILSYLIALIMHRITQNKIMNTIKLFNDINMLPRYFSLLIVCVFIVLIATLHSFKQLLKIEPYMLLKNR